MVERRGREPHLLAGARTPVPARRRTKFLLSTRPWPWRFTDTFAQAGHRPHQGGPTISTPGTKAGRHPDRTQLLRADARPHDRRNRHQRQPDGVRPRASEPPRRWPAAAGRRFDRREVPSKPSARTARSPLRATRGRGRRRSPCSSATTANACADWAGAAQPGPSPDGTPFGAVIEASAPRENPAATDDGLLRETLCSKRNGVS